MNRSILASALIGAASIALSARAQNFVHFESPHVHPLELTPDGSTLVAVNTVDARIEVYDVLPGAPYLRHAGSVAVGLEPVSVRARSATDYYNYYADINESSLNCKHCNLANLSTIV